MNYRYAGLLLVGILVVALAFSNNKKIEVEPMQSFTVHRISGSGGELQGVIVLNNPNILSSTIKNIHEKFYINGILLGILDNEINQGIPGRKETEFPVSIRFSNTDYQNAVAADTTHPVNTLVVTGTIEYQNLFKPGKAEVNQSVSITQ